MAKCVYTSIEYFPKCFSNESINVGFIFHNATEGSINFLRSKNKKRITSFDDELIYEDYNMLMDAFEEFITKPFKSTLFSTNDDIVKRFNENYLDSIKNCFLNEFRFSNIMKINSDNPLEDCKDYSKLYLYFDYDKKDRLSEENISKIVRKQLKRELSSMNVMYNEKVNVDGITEYGEPMKIDFKVGDEVYIKILDIRTDSFLKLNTAKVWAFNKQYFDNKNLTLIFALTSKPETVEEHAYYDILEATKAPIYTLNELDKLVISIQ